MKRVMPNECDSAHWVKMAVAAGVLSIGLAACGEEKQASSDDAATTTTTTATPAPTTEPAASTPAADTSMAGMEGMKGMDNMQGMSHDQMLTPEQFAEFREKIPLYKVLTDEEIMANMGRMPPDFWGLVSGPDMKGDVGILALGHGYKLGGNEQFEKYLEPISQVFPTTMAPGMTMMSSEHIQAAIDELTQKHGVKTVVVLVLEPGDDSSLVRQWKYAFGLLDESEYLSVPRIKTDAKVIFTETPEKDPRVASIMLDYALETADDPATARVILVSHGPETPEANPAALEVLQKHADMMMQDSDFKDIKVMSIQDDAVPEIRAAHIAELRDLVKESNDKGQEVVVVPMILTKGGFHARLQKDLDGLTFKFANRGLIEHPSFNSWIGETVRYAIGD